MKVAVCVASYRRPEGLKTLLDSLSHMKKERCEIYVFVADNDPTLSEAKKLVDDNANAWPFPIFCEIEHQAGISYARNKNLDMVKNSKIEFDYIAFTDDDIEVSYHWMDDLIRTSLLHEAEVVCGNCEPLFEIKPTKEVLESPFYTDNFSVSCTGSVINSGGTCNLLLKSDVINKMGYNLFDPNLAKIGGSDVELFTRIIQNGFKAVSCSTAVTYEMFPKERLTLDWVKKRYYRYGGSYCYILVNTMPKKTAAKIIIKKCILFPVRFIRAKIKPSIVNECKLLHEKGFFKAFLKKEYYEEYKCSSSNHSN